MLLFKLFVDIIRRKYQLNLIKVLFYLYIKKNPKKKKNLNSNIWLYKSLKIFFSFFFFLRTVIYFFMNLHRDFGMTFQSEIL